MREKMKWDDVYKLWQEGSLYLPAALSAPITPEIVTVDYDREDHIFGYDWLRNDEAQQRKQIIARNPVEFLLFVRPSNKGTITTVQMLVEAKSEEERAAIWIAATAFDLMKERSGGDFSFFVHQLNLAAYEFLQNRYAYMWHHAMRKLVPEIMIPYTVLDSVKCENAAAVMGLIQTNVLLIKGNYTPLLYSSIKEDDPTFNSMIMELSLHQ